MNLETIVKETATLFLTKDKLQAYKVSELIKGKITTRKIEQCVTINDTSPCTLLEDSETAEERKENVNSFVGHFEAIEAQTKKEIEKVEKENTVIKLISRFYNPEGWKKFMSKWVPKFPMWTALLLGDVG